MRHMKKTDDYEYCSEDDKKRLSRLLMISRAEGGISQEKMALELGVAKKTVQNWEYGVSAPTLIQAVEWFRVLNVAALPYLLQFIFPDMEGMKGSDDDVKIRKAMLALLDVLPAEGVRQLLYLFYGDHGSSPQGIMNMVTAHLQSPLRDRYTHGSMILQDYNLARDRGQLARPDHVQPDVEFLTKAVERSRVAILNERNMYTMLPEKEQNKYEGLL